MNPKLCERHEYTYRIGLELVCSVLECEKNNDGMCKDFKQEK